MITCVFRCASADVFLAKMDELQAYVISDDKGVRMRSMGEFEACPLLETAEPSYVATVRLTPEEYALVPEFTSPEFLLDYDSETEGLEWPEYDMRSSDGYIVTTWRQAAGKFA